MENCVFQKLYLEDNTPVRTYITLLDNSLKLIILQNEKAYKSFVISENLNRFAIQHKLNLEDYIAKLIEYFKKANDDVAFVMTEDEFIVNRLLNNFKVKYFVCTLEKVDYVECVEQIMDTFHSQSLQYANQLRSTINEKNEIETHKINCELQLKELIEKKRTDDEELFGRFVLILNEKKHRIQHLTELLEAFKAGRPTINPPVTVKNRKRKTNAKEQANVRKLETISESEPSESSNSNSENDYNSEEEKRIIQEETKPSTSTFNFLEDDFAQSPELPKRIKRDLIGKNATVVAPSTSKSKSTADNNETADTICRNSSKKDSPSIDFNTQQLLDML